jgi:hypothetical protein
MKQSILEKVKVKSCSSSQEIARLLWNPSSLPSSQKSAIGPYSQSSESSPYPPTLDVVKIGEVFSADQPWVSPKRWITTPILTRLIALENFITFSRRESFKSYGFKTIFNIILPPNVGAEWLVFFLRIREVMGSNLGPGTGCSEGFRVFPQSPQANAGILP